MTPEQKIKHLILSKAFAHKKEPCPLATAETIDDLYEDAEKNGYYISDCASEVREGEGETGLECEYSRHYEAKAVAAQMLDGSWVGWTYWYGGGKHGQPEAVEWMRHAYDLDCVEEEKLFVVRSFTKVDRASETN